MAPTDEDYHKMADEALEEAWELANSTDGWQELRNKNDAIVVTKMNKKGIRTLIFKKTD